MKTLHNLALATLLVLLALAGYYFAIFAWVSLFQAGYQLGDFNAFIQFFLDGYDWVANLLALIFGPFAMGIVRWLGSLFDLELVLHRLPCVCLPGLPP